MKKLCFTVLAFLSIGLLMTSCDKDEKLQPERFGTATVEQNKTAVEQAGIDFMEAMRRMEKLDVINVLVNLQNVAYMAKGNPFLKSEFNPIIDALIASGKTNNPALVLNAGINLSKRGSYSLFEMWSHTTGIYEFNSEDSTWTRDRGGDELVLKFPSSSLHPEINDAVFTAGNYRGITIPNLLGDFYSGDFPTSFNADLKVGNQTLASFVFNAGYNDNGTPAVAKADFTVGNFKYQIDVISDTTLASLNYKILEDGKTILDFGIQGEGILTEKNVNDNTHHVIEEYDDYTDEYDVTDFEEVVTSGNAHFQIGNVAIRGNMDIKSFVDELKILNENEELSGFEKDSLTVKKLNETINLRVVDVNSNIIFAKIKAYPGERARKGAYYVDLRIVFADDSEVAMDTYFNQGFDEFIDSVNDLINDINTDYDGEIDPIDY
jgi:hypothetical protein